jgi:carboxypeptidase PM20D1
VKKFLVIIVLGPGMLASVLLFRTARFTSRQIRAAPAIEVPLKTQLLAARLAKAIRFQTTSRQSADTAAAKEFLGLHRYLEQTFPQVHATVSKEVVGDYSLLYTWKGSDARSKPILLMGHMDVVPVEPGTEGNWTYSPFGGRIADGYIWGRGALDDKASVMAILEAVEELLTEGFQPKRTFYLAFGHDEEIGGLGGAAKIAGLLHSRGIELEYVLDEGGTITKGILPGVTSPVALVGIAEKGYVSLELTVASSGGHSSMPPRHTAVGILSTAIHRLERNPFPAKINGPTRALLETVGPEMAFGQRLVMANLWLFDSLVKRLLSASPLSDALIRTTTAATMFEGSVKENVLPVKARAVVNFRILPGESSRSVIDHVRNAVDDPRIGIAPLALSLEPSPVSDIHSSGYTHLQRTIRQVFPDAVVAPWLLVAATDSRHYAGLSENLYRFAPLQLSQEDIPRLHGTDERISAADYEHCVKFYIQLIRNSHS